MELTRRFIFNGSAAAFGGRFVRPEDVVLASTGGSALPSVGGRSDWRDRDIKIGKSFRIARAETSASGLVDSLRDAVKVTHGKLTAESLTATTTVSARIRGLEVGGAAPLKKGDEPEPLMTVSDVNATLVSRSAQPGHESSVIVGEASISTVTFDSPVHGRYKLDVVIDFAPFKRATPAPRSSPTARSCRCTATGISSSPPSSRSWCGRRAAPIPGRSHWAPTASTSRISAASSLASC